MFIADVPSEGGFVVCEVPCREQRAMLKDLQAEFAQIKIWQARIKRPDEILVKPLCFLDVKAYSISIAEIVDSVVE